MQWATRMPEREKERAWGRAQVRGGLEAAGSVRGLGRVGAVERRSEGQSVNLKYWRMVDLGRRDERSEMVVESVKRSC